MDRPLNAMHPERSSHHGWSAVRRVRAKTVVTVVTALAATDPAAVTAARAALARSVQVVPRVRKGAAEARAHSTASRAARVSATTLYAVALAFVSRVPTVLIPLHARHLHPVHFVPAVYRVHPRRRVEAAHLQYRRSGAVTRAREPAASPVVGLRQRLNRLLYTVDPPSSPARSSLHSRPPAFLTAATTSASGSRAPRPAGPIVRMSPCLVGSGSPRTRRSASVRGWHASFRSVPRPVRPTVPLVL